jgi:8-oxo-dGTP pyrophosphatase MutT (NUDIX family)
LIVRPAYKPILEIPGGITEHDESPKQCARREINEELRLTIAPGGLLVQRWARRMSATPEALKTGETEYLEDGIRL